MSIAPTFSARFSPSPVPRAAAPMTLASVRGTTSRTVPAVSGWPVSGTSILARRMVPGAVMMTAASRCLASTPKAM